MNPLRAAAAAFSLCLILVGAGADEVLRGRFLIDLEPVSAMRPGDPYPLDADTAGLLALEEAARCFAGMIYGWSFDYEPSDRARGVEDRFAMDARGEIPFGDPRLTATDAENVPSALAVWIEYRLDELQKRSWAAGREGSARNTQGIGYGRLADGPKGKAAALDDAAREAVRGLLRGSERNKPKEARGYVMLMDTPRYWTDEGRFVAAARFRVVVTEIVPYRFF